MTSLKTIKIAAFQIADQANLKSLRATYTARLISSNSSELFYKIGADTYVSVFNYGVVVFANASDIEMTNTLDMIALHCDNLLDVRLREESLLTSSGSGSVTFAFDAIDLPIINEETIHVAILNLAQSVALDYFLETSEKLLIEVTRFTRELEIRGQVSLSKRNMLKYIGKALNTKNKIIENLYIFDGPDLVWDDEYLDNFHRGLSRLLNLRSRFREVEYTFKVIEDNLSVFRELYLHRESSILEWIVIVLILIEVADLVVSKLR